MGNRGENGNQDKDMSFKHGENESVGESCSRLTMIDGGEKGF